MERIHKFKFNDKNIVMDINSGSIFVFDPISYDIIDDYEKGLDYILGAYSYPKEDLEEAYAELKVLVDNEYLLTRPVEEEDISYNESNVIKALCLHVAHSCDLDCRYCFASGGHFKGERALMSLETGKKALDFLVEHSGNRRNLEVDFFGGEPLLNFDVVKELTYYGQELNEKHGKNIRFTMTTNGTHLTDENIDFLNEHMDNIVMSLDGRKEVNDHMRPTRAGQGTFDKIVPNFQKVIEGRGDQDYYIRGTFTSNNLDFGKDVLEFHKLGFKKTSIEPVVTDEKEPYAIREGDLERILQEYEDLAKEYIRLNQDDDFLFYHFMMDLDQGPCLAKRSVGCGAGAEYVAVTPEGDIYPCHQFVGEEGFKIGSLDEGIYNKQMREDFKAANVFAKDDCKTCWARFYCSGGCHANAYYNNGDLMKPYKLGCEMEKKRIECSIGILASEVD